VFGGCGLRSAFVVGTRVFRRAFAAGLVLLGIVVAILWFVPSNDFIFLPDPATPADEVIHVPGEAENAAESEGGIYFLDVHVRKASVLETLIPGLREGASIVPAEVYNPERLSFEERREASLHEMSASQQIAIAVALRSLDYDVLEGGAEVVSVRTGFPASGKLKVGDVIVEARSVSVVSPEELADAMRGVHPGEPVRIRLLRDGVSRELELDTRGAPGDPDRAVFGIQVQPELTFPIDVTIDAGNVGGPSAGLAFALDVVDELGEDVDRGRRIAVTGELNLDGTVAPIGGMKQKTFGAREAGATVLIVPKENAAEARRYADGLTIVPVSSFRQALSYLTKV